MALGLLLAALPLQAQNLISVPFPSGFIGTRASSAGTANNVKTFATLGIARIFFIQNSSTNAFELQGNDIPGTMRIVRADGTTLDIPASANWRDNAGSTTYLIGILPRPASPITFAYPGGSIQITDGSVTGGTSIGGYQADWTGAKLADGGSVSGNAAQGQVLSSMNTYLTTVVASRPAGPVTVTPLTTTSTTPTIAGTATLAAGENLTVDVNGRQYSTSSTPAVVRSGNGWSLALTSAFPLGTYSVTATITNVDGFTLSDPTTGELTIGSSGGTVTIGGSFTANDKTYDGTTTASGVTSGLTLAGVNGGDQVTIASVTLAFPSATAGTGKTVAITGVTLGGTNGSLYSVSLNGAPTATATISAKSLTIAGVTAANKLYDGSTAALLTGTASYVGLASGESFTVSGTPTASFATAAAGTAKPVTVTGYTAPNANYTLTQPAGLTANVTAKALTIGGSFTAADRSYDGTTAATIGTNALTLAGAVAGDAVTLSSPTAAFASAAVGTAKPVTIASATLAGAAAGNYTLSTGGAPTATASITATALTIAGISAASRVYDGTTAATLTGAPSYVGLAAGESFAVSGTPTATFATANVGTAKPVTVAGYTAPTANYTVAQPTGLAANVTARPLTIGGSFTAADKSYDGSTSATIATNALSLVGVVGGDAVTLSGATATFASAAVGTGKPVSLTAATLGGAAAANYSLSLAGAPTTTAAITNAGGTVTIAGSFAANDKVYDGTTAASGTTTGLTLVGVSAPDQVTIASVSLAFQTAAAGTGKTVVVTGVTLGGSDAARYAVSVAGAPTATANVAPKPLAIAGVSASSKQYDGTTAATLTGTPSYVGLVAGESFAVSGAPSASFASAAVGTAKPVTIAGYAAPSANYALTQPTGVTAAVTAKPLTIGGSFSASNKPYDGTTSATIGTNALTLVGAVGGDDVSLSGATATFADATVGTAKPVSVSAASLAGAAAGNYTLTLAGAPTTSANITSAGGAVTIAGTFTANDRTYDGTSAAAGVTSGLTLVGVNPSDQVTIAAVTLAFQSAAAGTGKTVTITGVTLGGANGGLYSVNLTAAPTASATIAPKALAIGGSFGAASKPYDGTTTATIASNALTLVGVVGGDDVALTGTTAAFATATVGAAKPVSLTGATLTGAAAGNYTVALTGAPTTTASITSLGGTVTIAGAFSASDKSYDGTTTAIGVTSGLTLVGVTAPDQVTIASVTLGFRTSSAGTGKTVAITGVTLAGADAARYSVNLTTAPTAIASITLKPLTVGGSFAVADKIYDATTSATITASALRLIGVLAGDDVGLSGIGAAFSDPAVGAGKLVRLAQASLIGQGASNYALALAGAPTTTATIIPATPPSAPRAVVATAGDGTLAITWSAPAAAGCRAVTGYVVEYSTDDGRSWTRGASTTGTSATLSRLANNVAHRVRVAAENVCGTGPYSAPSDAAVPLAPTRDDAGRPVASEPGTAVVTTGGAKQPVTVVVVQDSVVRLTAGTFTLQLRASDQLLAPIPIDSSRTLELEQGGRATAEGSGFAPGTVVSLYLVDAKAAAALLGTAPVVADGTFASTSPLASTLAAGRYTLQVNGIDRTAVARSLSLGVEVAPPPPDLVLTATPDQTSPAVGDTLTITLTVTNKGRGPAIDVAIPRAFKEPGFTVVGTTPLEGSYDTATQTWTIRRIEPGASARMRLTVVVVPPAAPGTNP